MRYPTKSCVLICLACLVLSTSVSSLQAQERHTDTIPFSLTEHNNIAITCLLNDTDSLQLMFHLAASAVSLTTEATPRLQSLSFSQTDTVNSWGGAQESRSSTGNALRIGSLEWQELPIWESQHSGPGTDGKFGYDLFSDRILEIDYDHSRLILYDTLPKQVNEFHPLDLIIENDLLFLAGQLFLDSLLSNRFLLHSGYGGAVLFDDVFAAQHELATRLVITEEQILRDSYGNEIQVKKALLPDLRIGPYRLAEVPVGFFAGAIGRQRMSVFGGAALKRFNWIFDFQNARLYLQPSRYYESG